MDGLIGIGFAILLAYYFFKGGSVAATVSNRGFTIGPVSTSHPVNVTQTPAGWQVPGGTDMQICPSWGCGPAPIFDSSGGIFSATPGSGSGAPASAPTGGGGGTSGGTGTYSGGGGGGTGGGLKSVNPTF